MDFDAKEDDKPSAPRPPLSHHPSQDQISERQCL